MRLIERRTDKADSEPQVLKAFGLFGRRREDKKDGGSES